MNNLNWPYIPDHPYKILTIGGLGSGKTHVLLNLMKNQWSDIDKIYLYIYLFIPKAFTDYSQKNWWCL